MKKFYALLVGITSIFFVSTSIALADSGGISGRSVAGCGDCHGTTQSSVTGVSLLPVGTTSVAMTPGETRNFQIAVAHTTAPSGGVNISVKNASDVNVGTFTAGAGLRLTSGELTQSSPQPLSGTPRQVVFSFSWTAPATPGVYTMRAAGIVVNGNLMADLADAWRLMTNVTINVSGLTLIAPNGGEVWCRGVENTIRWSAAGIAQVILDYTSGDGIWNPIAVTNGSAGQHIWTIPGVAQPGANYLVRIRDAGGVSQDISNSSFSVAATPSIVTNLKTRDSVCLGAERTFTIITDNNTLYTYQWRKDGSDIPGATSASYGIQNVNPTHAGKYSVRVTGCSQAITSQEMYFYGLEAAQITAQPSSATACEGKSATLTVGATGWQLAYRWKRNGKDVSGGNKASLVIGNVNANTVGEYDCEVRGGCGTKLMTEKATLSAISAPKLLSQPRDTTFCLGNATGIGLNINDEPGLTYQWKLNGKILTNATTKNVSFNSFALADTGSYEVTITNACTLKTTAKIRVTVSPLVSITQQPQGKTLNVGEELKIFVKATGNNNTYQWFRDGKEISGAISDTLVILKVKKVEQGEYYCLIKGICNNVESEKVSIVINGSAGPILTFSQNNFTFNCTSIGRTRLIALPKWIINSGDLVLNINSITLTGKNADEFEIVTPTAPTNVSAKSDLDLTFKFTPKSVGTKEAQVVFSCNTNGFDSVLTLSMEACESKIDPWQIITLKSIPVNEVSDSVVKICNTGTKQFELTNADLFGQSTGISIESQETTPRQMNVGDCHSMTIRFAPTTSGPRSALLNFRAGQEVHSIIVQASTTVTSVEDNQASAIIVSAYPNPAQNTVYFEIRNTVEKVQITITDFTGSIIKTFNSDNHFIEWNTTDIASGQYTAKVNYGKETVSVPLLLIK